MQGVDFFEKSAQIPKRRRTFSLNIARFSSSEKPSEKKYSSSFSGDHKVRARIVVEASAEEDAVRAVAQDDLARLFGL